MVIEVTLEGGLTLADCPCRRHTVIIGSREVELEPKIVLGNLTALIGHVRRCQDPTVLESEHAARVGRLLAERYPDILGRPLAS